MPEGTAPTALDVEQLRALVADTADLATDEVTDDANFVDELEIDSLMAMEIMVQLEKTYRISLDESEFKEVATFADVRRLVETKLGAA